MVLLAALGCTEHPVPPQTSAHPTPPPAPVPTVPAPELAGVVRSDPACEVPGNVCVWLGFPGFAGFSGDGLPRAGSPVDGTLLYHPVDVTFAPDGTAYYPDYNNHRLRRVDPDGAVWTVSGTGLLGAGAYGDATDCWDGCEALPSQWDHPSDVLFDGPDRVWVASEDEHVSVLDPAAGTVSWFAGGGEQDQDGSADVDGDGRVLDDLALSRPSSVAVGDDGAVYVSDGGDAVVWRIDPDGTAAVLAGRPGLEAYDGDGGPAADALLRLGERHRGKLALDGRTLYVADTGNGVIRAIDLDSGTIDTVVGRYVEPYPMPGPSEPGYAGDDGPAVDAILAGPADVAVGPDGELYVADSGNRCVRVVVDGIIDGFAGICASDEDEPSGDGHPAIAARFGEVSGVALDADGDVYVADTDHHTIRRVKR